MRRGPLPKLPRVPEVKPFARDGESDQDYKCRLVSEKYQGVTGSNEQEADMVDFFKQVLAAENRVVISSFVISVMVSRYWGTGHLPTDTALTTISKTMTQLHAWMYPDRFATFVSKSGDHHDLIDNGYLVLSQVVADMNTQLMSGYTVGVYRPGSHSQLSRRSTSFGQQLHLTLLFGTWRIKRRVSLRRL